MILDIFLFIVGLLMLYFGAESLVRGASSLAMLAKIKPLIIGATVVAFGTSSPEFLVSFVAAFSGRIDIAIGNIVGSNIANIGLILGISCLLVPIRIGQTAISREYIWMIGGSLLFWLFSFNGSISRPEGIVLFASIIIFTIYLITIELKKRKNPTSDHEPIVKDKLSRFSPRLRIFFYGAQLLVGIAILIWGSDITIDAATNIARALGISEVIIGLSLVAFGTSLPEMATCIISLLKNESDILIGNIIGSNIYNILFVGGALGTTVVLPIQERLINFDIPVMLVISLILVPVIYKFKIFSRGFGVLLLFCYLSYIIFIYFRQ